MACAARHADIIVPLFCPRPTQALVAHAHPGTTSGDSCRVRRHGPPTPHPVSCQRDVKRVLISPNFGGLFLSIHRLVLLQQRGARDICLRSKSFACCGHVLRAFRVAQATGQGANIMDEQTNTLCYATRGYRSHLHERCGTRSDAAMRDEAIGSEIGLSAHPIESICHD